MKTTKKQLQDRVQYLESCNKKLITEAALAEQERNTATWKARILQDEINSRYIQDACMRGCVGNGIVKPDIGSRYIQLISLLRRCLKPGTPQTKGQPIVIQFFNAHEIVVLNSILKV